MSSTTCREDTQCPDAVLIRLFATPLIVAYQVYCRQYNPEVSPSAAAATAAAAAGVPPSAAVPFSVQVPVPVLHQGADEAAPLVVVAVDEAETARWSWRSGAFVPYPLTKWRLRPSGESGRRRGGEESLLLIQVGIACQNAYDMIYDIFPPKK